MKEITNDVQCVNVAHACGYHCTKDLAYLLLGYQVAHDYRLYHIGNHIYRKDMGTDAVQSYTLHDALYAALDWNDFLLDDATEAQEGLLMDFLSADRAILTGVDLQPCSAEVFARWFGDGERVECAWLINGSWQPVIVRVHGNEVTTLHMTYTDSEFMELVHKGYVMPMGREVSTHFVNACCYEPVSDHAYIVHEWSRLTEL